MSGWSCSTGGHGILQTEVHEAPHSENGLPQTAAGTPSQRLRGAVGSGCRQNPPHPTRKPESRCQKALRVCGYDRPDARGKVRKSQARAQSSLGGKTAWNSIVAGVICSSESDALRGGSPDGNGPGGGFAKGGVHRRGRTLTPEPVESSLPHCFPAVRKC